MWYENTNSLNREVPHEKKKKNPKNSDPQIHKSTRAIVYFSVILVLVLPSILATKIAALIQHPSIPMALTRQKAESFSRF